MARIVIEKDLSEGSYTESDPYVAPLGGDFRNFNVRSLTGDVRFRDENSSAWATLREGESWDCFDPPIDELRFAGDGSFEIVADTSVQISPSGGGGGQPQNVRDLLAWYGMGGANDGNVQGLGGRAISYSHGIGGTGASVSGGMVNGVVGVHQILAASGDDFTGIRGEANGAYVPYPSIFNAHGFDRPDAPDWMLFWEDDVVVSDWVHGSSYAAAFFGIGYVALNGTTGAQTYSFIGFRARTDLTTGGALQWYGWAGDSVNGWSVGDALGDAVLADELATLKVGVGIVGGVPTARLYANGELVKEWTDADFGDFSQLLGDPPTHVTWKTDGDSTGSITFSTMLGAGARLWREEL